MRVAAETFAITPRLGAVGQSLTAAKVGRVFGPLKTTVVLLESRGRTIALISSHSMTHYYRFSNLLRKAVADQLAIPFAEVLSFSSHNHCHATLVNEKHTVGRSEPDVWLSREKVTPEGQEIIDRAARIAAQLPERFEEVELRYGVGHERRISHNRKGHRADGTTYMMREEDRLRVGVDFCGDIDDDAAVVGFFNKDGEARAILAHFTAHPVTAFDPEHPVVFGEYAQIASDILSQAFGGAPVAFLQGCAGDVNSKGLLSGKAIELSVADATHYGHCLGQTWIDALAHGTTSRSDALSLASQWVELPFAGVPPLDELDVQIADMNEFLARCAANEPDTRTCQGLNFPSTMSPGYRGELVKPLLRWAHWARAFHIEGRLQEAPRQIAVETTALRLGDVGIVGMCCEPFQAVGRQIKNASPLALTLPCAYMHDICLGYVPDCGNLGDKEYMSASYRYTTNMLPYAPPAGDRLAQSGIAMLRQLIGQSA